MPVEAFDVAFEDEIRADIAFDFAYPMMALEARITGFIELLGRLNLAPFWSVPYWSSGRPGLASAAIAEHPAYTRYVVGGPFRREHGSGRDHALRSGSSGVG